VWVLQLENYNLDRQVQTIQSQNIQSATSLGRCLLGQQIKDDQANEKLSRRTLTKLEEESNKPVAPIDPLYKSIDADALNPLIDRKKMVKFHTLMKGTTLRQTVREA
jgi:hypothetical protein